MSTHSQDQIDLASLLSQAQESEPPESLALLQQALPLTQGTQAAEILLWMGQLQANLALWQEAEESLLRSLELAPNNHDTRCFLSEALVRNGQDQRALELLQGATTLSPEEEHRLNWLQQPEVRSQTLEEVGAILHPLYSTQALSHIEIRTYGPIPAGLPSALREFHEREFPGTTLNFHAPETSSVGESFEQLRDLVDVGELPDWANPDSLSLVSAQSPRATAYTAGIGTPKMMVLRFAPEDPFQESVTAHELYHSLLDLNHTNGLEGPDDCGSVMGPWGIRTPLKATYVSHFHRRFCTTTAATQALVEQAAWEEALQLDPHYLALYQKAATDRIRQEDPERALELLEGWFQHDTGPEAASSLGELLLHLGRSPQQVFERSLGYLQAANTHLYAAQACLNAYAFGPALEQLEFAESLDPHNIHMQGMMAWAYHGLGQKLRARNLYKKVLQRCPDWESLRGRLMWLQGDEYTAPYPDDELLWLEGLTQPGAHICQKLVDVQSQKALLCLAWRQFQFLDPGMAEQTFARCRALHPYTLEGKASEAWLNYLSKNPEHEDLRNGVLERWPAEPTCMHLKQTARSVTNSGA